MTEDEFRSNAVLRSELERYMQSDAFRYALEIITNRRHMIEQNAEATLASDPIVSVRLNSQRIGAEGVIIDLQTLCLPPVKEQPLEPETWGKDDDYQKLQQ